MCLRANKYCIKHNMWKGDWKSHDREVLGKEKNVNSYIGTHTKVLFSGDKIDHGFFTTRYIPVSQHSLRISLTPVILMNVIKYSI